jgi:hypothetical protein
VARAKFIALTGLAYSNDEGETFIRTSEAPFLGRLDGQNMIAAVHSAHFLNDTWHLWYAAGDAWENIDGKLYPRYEIRHIRTRELSKISGSGEISVKPTYPEYRIGRPRVYMLSNELEMHFTSGSISGDYLPGRAFSKDGVTWFRDTHDFPLKRSVSGWDSIHLCYPSIIEVGGSKYMFYNGNHMGIDGFGCAVLEQD